MYERNIQENFRKIITVTLLFASSVSGAVIIENGRFSETTDFSLNDTLEVLLVYTPRPCAGCNPHRIATWSSDISRDDPVLVVVRQQRNVVSWMLHPLNDDADSSRASRTLCDRNVLQQHNNATSNFTVILSTSSPTNVTVSVLVERTAYFYLTSDEARNVSVFPNQPQHFYYGYDLQNGKDIVSVDVASDDCLIASVQKHHCPVFDLEQNIVSEGVQYTIRDNGGFMVNIQDGETGFSLIFTSPTDSNVCTQKYNFFRSDLNAIVVRFTITEYGSDLAGLVVITLILLSISVVLVAMFAYMGCKIPTRDEEDGGQCRASGECDTLDATSRRTVDGSRRAYDYRKHVLNMAIFYGIPAVQLVFTYQKVVDDTGNADMCYYNFRCTHPLWIFNDFNHVSSNVGYVFWGALFLFVVRCREIRKTSSPAAVERGIPEHSGLMHAMGLCLIFEGVLSACYHVCPNQSTFQFDTSFMYAMAILCMVKLYYNRHPDICVSSYTTSFVLGGIMLVVTVGLLELVAGSYIHLIAILSAAAYLVLISFIFFSVYCVDANWTTAKQIWNRLTRGVAKGTIKVRKNHLIPLLTLYSLNFLLVAAGLYFLVTDQIDFGTFCLLLLMANSIVYTTAYTIMKHKNKERILLRWKFWYVPFFGGLAIILWGFASFFFFQHLTDFSKSPSESRGGNEPCFWGNFYDKHDWWHQFSAPALFFTFLYLECLDDDIVDVERGKITVF